MKIIDLKYSMYDNFLISCVRDFIPYKRKYLNKLDY